MRTLIVARSAHYAATGKLRRLLSSFPGLSEPVFASYENAETECAKEKVSLAIVLLPESPSEGQEVIGRLRETFQGHLIAVGEVRDPKVILRALQVGANVFCDVAELESEFIPALKRLLGTAGNGTLGRVLGVLSVSGGCGASTLAVNLAAALAREQKKCILIDLNSGRGDLAALLDLKPKFTLADVCVNEARLDEAMLGKMLVRHASGIDLLASSREFSDARSVTASGVKHVLSLSQALYRNVVVDLEDGFHPEQVEALRRASGLLLVCRLDFTALRNARRLLDHFVRLDMPRDRIRLVVNKRGHPGELPVAEAEDALGERLTAFVPYDPKTVNDANNAGVLLVLRHAKAKVAKSMLELANIDFSQQKGTSSILPNITQLLSNVVKGRGTA